MVNRLDSRPANFALPRWASAVGALLLLLVTVAPAILLAQAPDPVDHLRDLMAAERYAEAIEYADEVLVSDPANSRVAFWRDRAQSRLSGAADEHRVTTIERNAPPVRRPSTESLAPMTPSPQPAQPGAEAPASEQVAALPPPPPPPPPAPAPSGGIPKWVWIVAIVVVVLAALGGIVLRRGKGKAAPAAPVKKAAGLGSAAGLGAAASFAPRRQAPEPPPADVAPEENEQPAAGEGEEDPQDNIHDAVTQAGGAAAGQEANEGEVSFNSLMFSGGEETLFGDDMGPAVQQSVATSAAPPAPDAAPSAAPPAPDPAPPAEPPPAPPPPESYRSEPAGADAIVLGDPAELGDVDALDLGDDGKPEEDDDDGSETIRL